MSSIGVNVSQCIVMIYNILHGICPWIPFVVIMFSHWALVTYIRVSKLGHHWFRILGCRLCGILTGVKTEQLSNNLATATPPCWHQCKCQSIQTPILKCHSSYNALIWTQISSLRICVETLKRWQNQSKEFVLLLYWLTRHDFITVGAMR